MTKTTQTRISLCVAVFDREGNETMRGYDWRNCVQNTGWNVSSEGFEVAQRVARMEQDTLPSGWSTRVVYRPQGQTRHDLFNL